MTVEEFMERLRAFGFSEEQVRSLAAPPALISKEAAERLKAIPVGSGSFEFDPTR